MVEKFLPGNWLPGLAALLMLCLHIPPAAAAEWTLEVQPAALKPGDVALLEMTPTAAVASATLLWQDRRIPLVTVADGRQLAALIGIPRDTGPGSYRAELHVTLRNGQCRRDHVPLEIREKTFLEQHLSLPQRQVTPDRAALARHRRERDRINRVFAESLPQKLWQDPFQLPVDGRLLSPFGVQRILNGQPRSYHSGVDQRARLGEPVAAAGDGVVVLTADHFFAGNSVYIDHGMGIITMYFHLSTIQVEAGQRVAAGQTIGLAGATGRASGPHLHWGARVHNIKVDPLSLVRLLSTVP